MSIRAITPVAGPGTGPYLYLSTQPRDLVGEGEILVRTGHDSTSGGIYYPIDEVRNAVLELTGERVATSAEPPQLSVADLTIGMIDARIRVETATGVHEGLLEHLEIEDVDRLRTLDNRQAGRTIYVLLVVGGAEVRTTADRKVEILP